MTEYVIDFLIIVVVVMAITGVIEWVSHRIEDPFVREEIVRCCDCKYANEDGDECVYFAAWEPLPEGDEFRDVYVDVEPDGFCAWGERRQL